ncbi:hypothetical protein HZD82_22775, partial [Pantoea agglomerans]|nr:hypothetical protein [Pantoea agglomerans]
MTAFNPTAFRQQFPALMMVQISQLWQFLLFLFPLLVTLQLFKLQQKQRAGMWGQFIV